MWKRSTLIVLVLAHALLHAQQPTRGAAPPQDTAPQRDPARPGGTSVIRGQVTDAQTGRPLRAVVVSLYATARAYQGGLTDGAGRYEIQDVVAGRYRLVARSEGYLTLNFGQTRPNQGEKPLVLDDGQTVEHVDFHLPRGAAIAGMVRDDRGDPVAGVGVRALATSYSQGRRTLALAGDTQTAIQFTDDLGEFRIFGLAPGSFYVAAVPAISGANIESAGASYAPTYYPGTTNLADAQRVNVKLGEVTSNINLALSPMRMSTISAVVTDSDGRALTNPRLIVRQMGAGVLLPFNIPRPDAAGKFQMSGFTPGDYEIRVAGTSSGSDSMPLSAIGKVSIVNGEDVDGLHLVAIKMPTGSGHIVLSGATSSTLGPLSIEVVDLAESLPYQPRASGGGVLVRVQSDLTFSVTSAPGRATLRFFTLPRGWYLKSIRVNGTDVSDIGINFPESGDVSGIEIELTTHPSEISGMVRGVGSTVVDDYTVVVFARDPARRKGMTRYFATGRPDAAAKFVINGLPAGEYYAIALDWADPEASADPDFLEPLASAATPFTLGDGEVTSIDLILK